MTDILDVSDLSKNFTMHIRDGKIIPGFKGVSFRLSQGEFLGISGPSGIGKSSLLKCIYRTYIASGGHITYKDINKAVHDLVLVDEHKILELRESEIGFVTQFFHVIPRVPAFDVLTGSLVCRGMPTEEARETVEEHLTRLAIPRTLWQMFPSTFSGGEKQRLNIIHAVTGRPRLLLLDEPTSSLDPEIKKEVVHLLEGLKEKGTAMIGVFHDHDTMARLSDTVYEFRTAVEAVR